MDLPGLSKAAMKRLVNILDAWSQIVIGTIQTKHLSGPRPSKIKSDGLLKHTMTREMTKMGDLIKIKVGPRQLPYARIHELGGVIRPKNKKSLRFRIGNRVIFTKKVIMPRRPYLQPGFEAEKNTLEKLISTRLTPGLGGGNK